MSTDDALRCGACDHANRPGARFCDACGAVQAHQCGHCGSDLRPNAKFCDACGAPLGGRAEQQGQHYYDAELHRLRAEILLDMDGNAAREAEALFGQSLEIARRQAAKTSELRAATSLARLWQRQGKRDEARDLLVPVYAWFAEGAGTRDLKDAKALLEELE